MPTDNVNVSVNVSKQTSQLTLLNLINEQIDRAILCKMKYYLSSVRLEYFLQDYLSVKMNEMKRYNKKVDCFKGHLTRTRNTESIVNSNAV